jgi:PKD repeat protein
MGVNFNDISSGIPSQWLWTFEGGNPSTSTEKNPVGITYPTEGMYNVTLKATNVFGTNTLTLIDYITVTSTPLPYLYVTVSDTNPCIGNSIFLSDTSLYNPTAWEWWFEPSTVNFLNGTSSSSQNAEVKFTATGDYTVGHKVWNVNGMSTIIYENLIHVSGGVPDYDLDMEDGYTGYFVLWDTIKSEAKVDLKAAFQSNLGLHMQGSSSPAGWKGGPTNTTATQAWVGNRPFQCEAHICGVDAVGIPYLVLSMDMRQTSSYGPLWSWFRVLVNGVQIPDDHGVLDFNPLTLVDDPWKRLYFDLSAYTGSAFDITLQSSCRYSDRPEGEGDNVLIDNISITNTSITEAKKFAETELSIFPNPSEGRIKIKASPIAEHAVIKVSSMIGEIVYTEKVSSKNSKIALDIDLSFLTPGIYSLSITDASGNKPVNQRFVIR